MASLADIMPVVVEVDVRGTKIEVTGLATKTIASMLARFPTLRMLFDRAVTASVVSVDPKALFTETPDAVAEIIVDGLKDKSPGRDSLLAMVEALGIVDQLTLLRGVLEATMPQGLGPFADAVASTLGGSWGNKPAKATDQEIPGLTVLDPSSPPPLSAALMVDTTGMTPSPSRRGNSSVSAN